MQANARYNQHNHDDADGVGSPGSRMWQRKDNAQRAFVSIS